MKACVEMIKVEEAISKIVLSMVLVDIVDDVYLVCRRWLLVQIFDGLLFLVLWSMIRVVDDCWIQVEL